MHRSVEEVLRRPQSVVDCVNLYVGMWVVVKVVHIVLLFFFFFQAEDGIRDLTVTGVQTCALPICAAVRLAATHRKRTDRAQQEAHDRRLEELALAHVTDRVAERELDPRRVLPVDVVRDEDVAAGLRDVLRALKTPRREESRKGADDRKSDAPAPEAFFRKDRRSGEDGHERVTCSTRSRASPTDRPSVSTRIASLAARSGATVRVLSSSSRRRISVSKSCRERFSPRAASSSSRRRARSEADAVRNTLRSAWGRTTVPISRPTITIRPRFAMSR